MNSIRNVQRAIRSEAIRQASLLDAGKNILQETRGFNDETGETTRQRSKEHANDYRYAPCPDLPPIRLSEEWINDLKKSLPKLLGEILVELQEKYDLGVYDADVISESKSTSDYFYAPAEFTKKYKAIANWIISSIKNLLNEKGVQVDELNISLSKLARLIQLVEDNQLSFSIASSRVLPALMKSPSKSPLEIAEEMKLIQDKDETKLLEIVEDVIVSIPDKVSSYKKGKKGLLSMFVGEIMKKSKGKVNPKISNKLLIERLKR